MSFYLTLRSTAETRLSSGTNGSDFVTHFAVPLDLSSGPWEVGLAEIYLPDSTSVNIRQGYGTFMVQARGGREQLGSLNAGDYTIDDLCTVFRKAVNEIVPNAVTSCKVLDVEHAVNRVVVKISPGVTLRIDDDLAWVLGYRGAGNTVTISSRAKERAPFCYDVRGPNSLAYVYCSLMEHRRVGDTMGPLLRVTEAYDFLHVFPEPQYQKAVSGVISDARVYIKRGDKLPLDMQNLDVVCTLHFRKCRSEIYRGP